MTKDRSKTFIFDVALVFNCSRISDVYCVVCIHRLRATGVDVNSVTLLKACLKSVMPLKQRDPQHRWRKNRYRRLTEGLCE